MHNTQQTKTIIKIMDLIPTLTSSRDRLGMLRLARTLLNNLLMDEEKQTWASTPQSMEACQTCLTPRAFCGQDHAECSLTRPIANPM